MRDFAPRAYSKSSIVANLSPSNAKTAARSRLCRSAPEKKRARKAGEGIKQLIYQVLNRQAKAEPQRTMLSPA